MNKDKGGPAFPTETFQAEGMTLRDYFAAKAMQAEVMNNFHESDFAWSAARAYKMADAMLKERNRND